MLRMVLTRKLHGVVMEETAGASTLETHVGYWLRFVSNHVSHAFAAKLDAEGVTVAEWVFLRELLRLGETSPSSLADALGMTRGAISKLEERLLNKGFVDRTADPHDRRQHTVSLTPDGRALVPRLARRADENDAELFGHLEASEREALVAQLRSIVAHHQWKSVPTE